MPKRFLKGLSENAFLYIAMGEEARGQSYLLWPRRFRDRFQDAIGQKSIQRVGLPEIVDIKREVLAKMLDPKEGLEPTMAAQLRTNLGLPADFVPDQQPLAPAPSTPVSTNTATASPAQPLISNTR